MENTAPTAATETPLSSAPPPAVAPPPPATESPAPAAAPTGLSRPARNVGKVWDDTAPKADPAFPVQPAASTPPADPAATPEAAPAASTNPAPATQGWDVERQKAQQKLSAAESKLNQVAQEKAALEARLAALEQRIEAPAPPAPTATPAPAGKPAAASPADPNAPTASSNDGLKAMVDKLGKGAYVEPAELADVLSKLLAAQAAAGDKPPTASQPSEEQIAAAVQKVLDQRAQQTQAQQDQDAAFSRMFAQQHPALAGNENTLLAQATERFNQLYEGLQLDPAVSQARFDLIWNETVTQAEQQAKTAPAPAPPPKPAVPPAAKPPIASTPRSTQGTQTVPPGARTTTASRFPTRQVGPVWAGS